MDILGIVGSSRKNGNTDLLVKKVLEGAAEFGFSTHCINLADFDIAVCKGCEGCAKTCRCVLKDDMQEIYPMLESTKALVLGSPTYFYNVSGYVKAFMDRLYCYDLFHDTDRAVWMPLFEATGMKYAVTVAVCEQADEADMGYTSPAMSRTLEAVGYRVVDNVKALHVFAKGEITQHPQFMERSLAAGHKLGKTLQLRHNTEQRFCR